MGYDLFDFTDTKEMFVRINGKLIYLSYQMNNTTEYKNFLINKALS